MWKDGRYVGEMLTIDPSSQTVAKEALDRDLHERFMGGRG
jgi:hypothetical protein